MMNHPFDASYFDVYRKEGRMSGVSRGRRGQRAWARFLRRYLPDSARLLEVGCGLGHFGTAAQEHFEYVGTDLSEEAVAWARAHLGLTTQVMNAEEPWPFKAAQFDGVVAFDVTEHLSEPARFFAEAARVLRVGGIVVIRTPNTRSLGVRLKEDSENLTASMYHDETHISLLDPEAWHTLMTTHGFEIVASGTKGLWDVPYVERVPVALQKAVLLSLDTVMRSMPYLPSWSIGENLIVVARRSSAALTDSSSPS